MDQFNRRDVLKKTSVLAALGLTSTAVLAADDDAKKEKKEKRAAKLAALPPHWFDALVTENEDAATLIEKLAKNDQFKATVAKSIEMAKKDIADRPEGFVGPTYAQLVRLNLSTGLREPGFLEKKGKKGGKA